MKRILTMLCALCISAASVFAAENGIARTNIAGVSVLPPEDSADEAGYIEYADGTRENIDCGYVGLFINGSIVKNAEIIIENGRSLVPVSLVSEKLQANVEWIPETKEIIISDKGNMINLKIGNATANLNGNDILLEVEPKIINSSAYVPLRFLIEAFGAEVEYSDGEDLSKTHIIRRIPHIMISRYDKNETALTKEKCVEIVREQLIEAYQNRYGDYESFDGVYEKNGDDIRKAILNLNVTEENDRYYVIPVVFDFWVDKYTGDVYVFYNGQKMNIYLFDPLAPGALAFAG